MSLHGHDCKTKVSAMKFSSDDSSSWKIYSIRQRSIVRCVESYPFQITRIPNSIRSRRDNGQLMIWQSVSSWKLNLSLWAVTLRVQGKLLKKKWLPCSIYLQILYDLLCPFTDNWQVQLLWWWETNNSMYLSKLITSYLALHNCCAQLGDHVISFFEVRHNFCWRNPSLLGTTFIIRYWSPLSSIVVIKSPVMCEKCRSMSLNTFIGKISIHVFGWLRRELRHALGDKKSKTCIWKKLYSNDVEH